MQTKLATLRGLWAAGEYRKALKLAASWPRLGPQKDAIQGGWSAASSPDFYCEIGKDPAAMYAAGLAAIAERYGFEQARETLLQ